MTTAAPQNTKRLYSWWWNSHVSPKNSKWLQENLSDMDVKVKQMIKLLEEDADSFARRAEMYYKKRPELLKLVEEFYRAYLALAERYDNATGVLRHAQRTMVEAFPNQVAFSAGVDTPTGNDPNTPDASPIFSAFGHDDFPKEASGGRARKGLSFDDLEHNGSHVSELLHSADVKFSALESDVGKYEADKESKGVHYQQMMEKFYSLEEECNKSKEFEHKMEAMKDEVTKLEEERQSFLVQFQNFEQKISELEKTVSLLKKDAADFEMEASSLKEEMAKLGAEKENFVFQHKQSLLALSETEAKLQLASDDSKKTEKEFELANVKYSEEKKMLKLDIEDKISKQKAAEERCFLLESLNQSLQTELQSFSQKIEYQEEEKTATQHELKILRKSLEEEHLRYVEAETAFQTLQQLHSQCQVELASLATEIKKQNRMLEDVETYNQQLQAEIEQIAIEKNNLTESHLSSLQTIQELHIQNGHLTDKSGKLECEVDLRTDQRNALQQDIYCLKEELNELKKKHQGVIGDIESVGFNADNLSAKVKDLKEDCVRGRREQDLLLGRLSVMEKIAQEKLILENSLSDLIVESEGMKNSLSVLEENCKSLTEKNSKLANLNTSLQSQLLACEEDLESVTGRNSFLEKSLLETQSVIETLEMKLKNFAELCSMLENEKLSLAMHEEDLVAGLNTSQKQLETLNAEFKEMEKKNFLLEKEVEELKRFYNVEMEEHEVLKVKSKSLEDSFRLLEGEKFELHNSHQTIVRQVESVGFSPVNLASSLKDLLEQNTQLRQDRDRGDHERSALLQEKLLLTKSSHAVNSELESVKMRVKALEDSYQTVLQEKSIVEDQKLMLESQLQNFVERNNSLEKSLLDAQSAHGKLQVHIRSLDDLCSSLQNDKSSIATKHESLATELNDSLSNLSNLRASHRELELKKVDLEKDVESASNEMEKIKARFGTERQDHEKLKEKFNILEDLCISYEISNTELALAKDFLILQLKSSANMVAAAEKQRAILLREIDDLKNSLISKSRISELQQADISHLRDDLHLKCSEFDAEVEKLALANIEIFILESLIQDSYRKNISSVEEHQKLMAELMHENSAQRDDLKCLLDKVKLLENALFYVVHSLDAKQWDEVEMLKDKHLIDHVVTKLEEKHSFISSLQAENQKLVIENSLLASLMREMQLDFAHVVTAKTLELNEERKMKQIENDQKEAATQELQNLKHLYTISIVDNRFLMNSVSDMEEELLSLLAEKLRLETLSLILKGFVIEFFTALREMSDDMRYLRAENARLKENQEALLIQFQREVDDWESHAETMFGSLQESATLAKLYERKLGELAEICSALDEENRSFSAEINLLKERMKILDAEKWELQLLNSNAESTKPARIIFVGGRESRKTEEISEISRDVIPKDIVLDHISECSSYGVSRRAPSEDDDQMLKLWETTNHGGSSHMEGGIRSRSCLSMESFSEDLSIDKLEISKTFSGTFWDGTKLLERLNSDEAKLSLLNDAVHELKLKMDGTGNCKHVDYDVVQEQLEESAQAIRRLSESNKKLKKSVEENLSCPDDNSAVMAKRKRVANQARRGSEKIGRLQLEVQKLEFILTRLDGAASAANGGQAKGGRKVRVPLRDYLYGRTRSGYRRDVRHFCCLGMP